MTAQLGIAQPGASELTGNSATGLPFDAAAAPFFDRPTIENFVEREMLNQPDKPLEALFSTPGETAADADTKTRGETSVRKATAPRGDNQILNHVIEHVKMLYPLLDVLRRNGVAVNYSNGFWIANCPFPNHADSSPSFKINRKKPNKYLCYGCQAKGDVLDFVRDYHHLSNDVIEHIEFLTGRKVKELWAEMQRGGGGKQAWGQAAAASVVSAAAGGAVVVPNNAAAPAAVVPSSEEQGVLIAEEQTITETYIALLGLLDLDECHQAQIEQRGMRVEEAVYLGYRSLPVSRNERIRICKELRQSGYDLKNVPGFFRLPPRNHSKGAWCFGGDKWGFRDIKIGEEVYPVRGLLIPTKDISGKIRRLKVRNDAPAATCAERIKECYPERYMAFSSTDRCDGAGCGAWLHVSHPIYGCAGYLGSAKEKHHTLWVTEGEIKADVAALFLGETVAGLPGVGQCPELALAAARDGSFKEMCIAMDAEDKAHVKLAVARLVKLAKENGFEPSVAVWEAVHGKGLDDLLAAGGAPQVISPEHWWNDLALEHKKYITERLTGRGAVQ